MKKMLKWSVIRWAITLLVSTTIGIIINKNLLIYIHLNGWTCFKSHCTVGSVAFTESDFGKPEKTIHMNAVKCKGREKTLEKCSHEKISLNEGEKLYKWIEVAGVGCNSTLRPTATMHQSTSLASNTLLTTITSSVGNTAIANVTVIPGAFNKHVQANGMTIGMSVFSVILILIVIATAVV